jgi:hypothetical protein
VKATLVLLAVTVMKTGVCIAGVRREAPDTWVRPVRDFGTVLLGDITYPTPPGSSGERRAMRPFDVVELTLGRARPDPPHIEDWTCDFAHSRPRLLATLAESERAHVLEAASGGIDTIWTDGVRSLGTLRVDDLSATFTADAYAGTYEARVVFPGLPSGVASVACTDLKWRALGRGLLARGQAAASQGTTRMLRLGGDELRAVLGEPADIWLALGLTRARDGRHWPLVVGVHTVPEYEADVDYNAL